MSDDYPIPDMDDTEDELRAEIARLQELLRGVGANRYWEGRWRDADAENQKLRAALEEIRRTDWRSANDGTIKIYGKCSGIARKALAKEGK